MAKQLICTIGYTGYVVDQQDAVVLLGIAARMVAVERGNWRDPYRPKADADPFVTAMELADVDMAPPEPEPMPQPEPAPAPLRIAEQRKLTHQAAADDETPY